MANGDPTYNLNDVGVANGGGYSAKGLAAGVYVRNGSVTGRVPTGAGNTVIKAAPGRLARAVVTTAGTGTGQLLFYDNATTNSGTVIGAIPATIAVGTTYEFSMPAANGITAVNVLNGPVVTVSYD